MTRRKEYSSRLIKENNENECYWQFGRPYELLVYLQNLGGKEYDMNHMKVCTYCNELIVDPYHKYRTIKREDIL